MNQQKLHIQNLENSNKKSEQIANKLNKEFLDLQIKYKNKKSNLEKDLNAEIKSWRKDLGNKRKEKILAEKKLEAFQKEKEVKKKKKKLNQHLLWLITPVKL